MGPVEQALREQVVAVRRRLSSLPPPEAPVRRQLQRAYVSPFHPSRVPTPPPQGPSADAFRQRQKDEVNAVLRRISPSTRIIAEVAQKHNVKASDILGKSRSRLFVSARHECCYRLVMEEDFSLPKAGHRLGGIDHTTVLHGIRRHLQRHPELLPVYADTLGMKQGRKASLHQEVTRRYFDDNWPVMKIMEELDLDRNMVNSIIRSEVRKVRRTRL